MKAKRKAALILMPFFVAVLLLYTTNSTINQHCHTFSSGITLKHAHPFSNGGNKGEHSHTTTEYLILDHISVTIFFLSIIIFLLMGGAPFVLKRNPITVNCKVCPDLFFLNNYHAPPKCCN